MLNRIESQYSKANTFMCNKRTKSFHKSFQNEIEQSKVDSLRKSRSLNRSCVKYMSVLSKRIVV